MNHITDLDRDIREARGLLTTINPDNLTIFQAAVMKTAYDILKGCDVTLRKIVLDFEINRQKTDNKRIKDMIEKIKEHFNE